MEVEDLAQILNLETSDRTPLKATLPLSLLCIQTLLRTHCISRFQNCPTPSPISLSIGTPSLPLDKKIEVTACMRHERLKNLFVKNVKPKKRYEIGLMAEETAYLAAKSGVSWILDVGSGVGHLCRILGYGYALNACGVESQKQLCEKAQRLDSGLEETASKHLSEEIMTKIRKLKPRHINDTIRDYEAIEGLTKILTNCSGGETCPDFGIVGLHPCGDLAVVLLRVFVECPQAKFINIVGCCYHKLTISCNAMEYSTFPISTRCSSENPQISTEAGALGCHAIETYCSRLMQGDYDYLKIHCYRAALERIITKHWPDNQRCGLSNVAHYPDLTFSEYCRRALQKFPLQIPEDEYESLETKQELASWKKVVCYYSVWLLMGPAVESLILLDRLIYIQERGIKGELKALFDPSLSPRNLVLSAIKD